MAAPRTFPLPAFPQYAFPFPAAWLACLVLVFAASAASGVRAEWLFLPTGADPRPEIAQLAPGFDREGWHAVSPPHAFDKIQPEDDVFGWYVRVLEVPAEWRGRDLFLGIGLVDDSDATFFNGTKVGAMGSFTVRRRSAWDQDRRYRVPAEAVRYGEENVLAIQVKDFTGIGGLLGRPFVGACLPGEWTARFRAGDGPPGEFAAPGLDDSAWDEVPLPDADWNGRQRGRRSYGWYRYRFDLPEGLLGGDLLVDLGRIYDVGACYLNGELAGQMGKFPPGAFLQTAGRFRLVLPARLLKARGNVLAVRVYNDSGFGGLIGPPAAAIAEQALLAKSKTVEAFLAANAGGVPGAASASGVLSLAEFLIHSVGGERAVAEAMPRPAAEEGVPADVKHRAASWHAYALWLAGDPDGAPGVADVRKRQN